jgi:hypothetical protein
VRVNVATRLKLEQMEKDIKDLKTQVAALIAERDRKPATLTLEKRKRA